jgi:hypothetical protein
MQCVASIGFFTRLLVLVLVPLVLLPTIMLVVFGCLWAADRRDFSDNEEPRQRRAIYRLKSWRLLLFTIFLVYPGVSSGTISMFVW